MSPKPGLINTQTQFKIALCIFWAVFTSTHPSNKPPKNILISNVWSMNLHLRVSNYFPNVKHRDINLFLIHQRMSYLSGSCSLYRTHFYNDHLIGFLKKTCFNFLIHMKAIKHLNDSMWLKTTAKASFWGFLRT